MNITAISVIYEKELGRKLSQIYSCEDCGTLGIFTDLKDCFGNICCVDEYECYRRQQMNMVSKEELG